MTGIAALAIGAAFVSCSHEIEQLSQEELNNIEVQKIKGNYEQAFIKTFGQPVSNQDWGFGVNNARTRTAFPNSNEWDKSYKVPKAITAGERDTVMTYFRTTRNPQSETVDIHNYFVQHVGYTDTTYTTTYKKDGRDERVTITNPGRSNMDYIFVGPGYKATAWNDPTPTPILDNDGDDHVYNLNAGSGEIQLILYSGSEYFGYHDSYGTGYSTAGHGNNGKYCEVNRNFVIRFIEHGGQVDCYVGFNYESGKTSEGWRLAPDEYFSDRVIKLVPGNGKWTSDADLRIIAEDLSAGEDDDDFDFNDVVIDVYYGDQGQAKAKILAAGGTLQLKVDGKEVHEEFSKANNNIDCAGKMINTNGTNSADANVRSKSLDGLTAPVITLSKEVKTPIQARDNIKIEVFKNNQWIELEAAIGKVASKVRVGTDYVWKDERSYVGDGFKAFVAGTASYDEWYQNNQ